jgi:hypothetical protein
MGRRRFDAGRFALFNNYTDILRVAAPGDTDSTTLTRLLMNAAQQIYDGTNLARARGQTDFAAQVQIRDSIAFSVSPVDTVLVTNDPAVAIVTNSRNLRAPILVLARGSVSLTLTPSVLVGTQDYDFEDMSLTTAFQVFVLRGRGTVIEVALNGNLRGRTATTGNPTVTVGAIALP